MSLFVPRDHVRIEFAVLRTITTAVRIFDEKNTEHPLEEYEPVTCAYNTEDGIVGVCECRIAGDGYVTSETNSRDITGVYLDIICINKFGETSDLAIMKTSDPYDNFLNTFDIYDAPRGVYKQKMTIQILPEEIALCFREELIEGRIESHVITESGRQVSIPRDFWRTKLATEVLKGNSACKFEYQGEIFQGYVVVHQDVYDFIIDEINNDSDSVLNNISPIITPGDEEDLHDPEFSGSIKYLPPYLYFMVAATQELGLKSTERKPKEEIENWIRSNWPLYLLDYISDDKIRFMATFLRHPEDAAGGHFKRERPKLPPIYRWWTGYYPPKEDPEVTHQRKMAEYEALRAANDELEKRLTQKP